MKDSRRVQNLGEFRRVISHVNILRAVLLAALAAAFVWTVVPKAIGAQSSPTPSASASGAQATVDTKNFAYVPATLTVAPGTTVVFKNSDSVAHTVTAADKSFDSGNMDGGSTWSHVFAKAGTYAYVCAYHTYMQGTIVVK